MENINLCEEIVKESQRLGLSESFLDYIRNSELFKDVYDKNMAVQRSALTILFFRILLNGKFQAPPEIRIALNSANDHISWLDDIKLVILPFIKENQDAFF